MKTVLFTITSLMTDRASAMKSYGRLFEEHVKKEVGEDLVIHFLHCNAHYLLGLVSACEKAVNAIECEFVRENGPLGRDKEKFFRFADFKESATFRLLRTACDVFGPNGDQKMVVEWIGCHFVRNLLFPLLTAIVSIAILKQLLPLFFIFPKLRCFLHQAF